MIKIIQFKPLEFKDTQFGRLLKPFEDAGLVYKLPNSVEDEITLVKDICKDRNTSHCHYDHIVNSPKKQTPSSVYEHIHKRDAELPALMSYREVDGSRRDIRAIKNHHELQSLLGIAYDRGYVHNAEHLL